MTATEPWPPNVPVAHANLDPHGISVRPHVPGEPLPAGDGEFTLVLNRHGAYDATEVHRVLDHGGVYLRQAVGRSNDLELNSALSAPLPVSPVSATLENETAALERAGFTITDTAEAFIEYGFRDIGAVVFHLTAVSWQIAGFDIRTYDRALRKLDERIRRDGELTVHHHQYFITAART